MTREPAITLGMISGLVAAVLALLVAFGVGLSDAQTGAILAVIAAAGPVLSGLLTRPRVTPNPSVVERIDDSGMVVAGEGSELETGLPIREAGSLDDVIDIADMPTPRHAAN